MDKLRAPAADPPARRWLRRITHAPSWLVRNTRQAWFQWRYLAPAPLDRGSAPGFPSGLEDFYRYYVAHVSSPDMAVSLELARVLYRLCALRRPRVILDLGSGFSSLVFRWWARQSEATDVWSIDNDPAWLERTRKLLLTAGLPTEHMANWGEVPEIPPFLADLMLHDFGSTVPRVANLSRLVRFAHEETLLVLDDVHQSPIRSAAMQLIASHDLHYSDLRSLTQDQYGRYAWLVFGFPGARTR